MGQTIAYYCGGIKPIIELLVSIYSYRKFYSDRIVVCLGETSVPYLDKLLKTNDIETIIIPNTKDDVHVRQHWKSRWVGMDLIEDDYVLHPDCDTVCVGDIQKFFDTIDTKPEYITSWHTANDGEYFRTWPGHIREYQKVDPDFDPETKPFYIEFGMVGWTGKWPYCLETSHACGITKDDQTAMSYVLMKNGRKAHKPQFKNEIFRRILKYYMLSQEDYANTLVWHTSTGFGIWWREFLEAYEKNYLGLRDHDYLETIAPKVLETLKSGNIPLVRR